MATQSTSPIGKLRVDKWLWAARFFKTRSLASDAIAHNRIKVNGQRIKPSRALQVGDNVEIEKPPYTFSVTVLRLNNQRRPAVEAATLYEESEHSKTTRESIAAASRIERQMHQGIAGEGRPSKKQRRQIIRFQNLNDSETPDN